MKTKTVIIIVTITIAVSLFIGFILGAIIGIVGFSNSIIKSLDLVDNININFNETKIVEAVADYNGYIEGMPPPKVLIGGTT